MLDDLRSLSREFLKLRYREYQRYFIQADKLGHRFSIILGDRGIGKTTTLIQYLLHHAKGKVTDDDILYIQADHIVLGNLNLYEIAEEFYKLGGKFIAFDEIHKYANWSMDLKSIYDTFPNLVILASGSSALQIQKGSHDLSRRAVVYKMMGLSLREFIEIQCHLTLSSYTLDNLLSDHETIAGNIITQIEKADRKILQLFRDYLSYGYYPYYLEFDSTESFHITLEQNIHASIESDLLAVHPDLSGHSIRKLKQLMSYVAQSVPFTPNWSKIKNVLSVTDNRTVQSYMTYLENAGLILMLKPNSGKFSDVEKKEKVYMRNPNQMFALDFDNADRGSIRETFFLSMLQSQYNVSATKQGDFRVNKKYIFEVGGKKKKFEQIKNVKHAYLAVDDIEVGINNKVPLWLFGFLY